MIIDRLYDSVEKNGHVCVGLDTAVEYLPDTLLKSSNSIEQAMLRFNQEIIDATLDVASCFKVQIAYYEAMGMKGMQLYKDTLDYLRKRNAIIIADIKRGDISKTAEMYAKAHFEGDFESDFVTLSPYMGLDGIEPYLPYVENKEKGLFVLVRTSNKGAADIQYIDTASNTKVYNEVGRKIQEMGNGYLGDCGYSSIGGVVGCTHGKEGMELRKSLDRMFFLIPGYGAQGGTAEDVALYLKDGNGGVVNSSRGILLAYRKQEGGEARFAECSRAEAVRMRDDILKAVNK
ncbi:MAG: orotidine 5-phosphate decarboxylase [Firmicutes bacterium]|nr:orotidine 5-phosphate decarboxylase [Bacillota bacterium]